MSRAWKVESSWDGYCNCTGQILYFHKKENAEKLLREWLTIEVNSWDEVIDFTWWPGCKTREDVVDYLVSHGGDKDIAWIDTVKFEDEEEAN